MKKNIRFVAFLIILLILFYALLIAIPLNWIINALKMLTFNTEFCEDDEVLNNSVHVTEKFIDFVNNKLNRK